MDEDQAWGRWKLTKDRETFRWISPETDKPVQELDIEKSVATTDFNAVETRLKRFIGYVDDNTSVTSEVRIISSLRYAANAVKAGDYIADKFFLD